jgi:hypothetical protein
MGTSTSPHEYASLSWLDRFFSFGRCRHCIAPKEAHPMPLWFPARALNDSRCYTNEEAHEIYYDESSENSST